MIRIALDAMGGDYAPKEVVRGAIGAFDLLGDEHRLVLLGVEEAVRQALAEGVAAPVEELVYLDMAVEDALKLILSGGMVTPASLRERTPAPSD